MNQRRNRLCLYLLALMLLGSAGCQSPSNAERLIAEHERTQGQLDRLTATLDQISADVRAIQSRQSASSGYSPPPAISGVPGTPSAASTTISVTPAASPAGNPGLANVQRIATPTAREPVRIRVPGEVLFGSGKASLDSSSKRLVDQWLDVIQRHYPDSYIRIEGFSDGDPIRNSTWNNNDELSQKRAQAVKDHFVVSGFDASRIEAVGMGAVRQRSTKALSRRAEVSLLVNQ